MKKFDIKKTSECRTPLSCKSWSIYLVDLPSKHCEIFSSETLKKNCLSYYEVEAIIVLENVMKVYTFLRQIRYKKLTQLCVKLFQNRNRND